MERRALKKETKSALATHHCETLVRRNGDLDTGALRIKQPCSGTRSVVKGRAVPLPARGRVWLA